MSGYGVKNITEDLTFLMTLTNFFGVDEKGFWIDIQKEERFKYQIDPNDTAKEIVLFQDPFPKGDYYYFNPLAEGLGNKSPADLLYQRTIRANLNSNIRIAVIKLITLLVESKEKDGESLNHVALRMASVPIDRKTSLIDVADEKLIEETRKIFDRTVENFFSVPYMQQQQTAKAICDVFADPQWEEKYCKDIRKKSIGAFKSAILGVLGIEDAKGFDQFSVKYNPESKSAARFDTILRVYHKLYSRFNDILPEGCAIDLGTLNDVIERLPMAYAIAKHMVQPTLPRQKPTDLSPSDTSRIHAPSTASGKAMPTPFIDNRQAVHTPVTRFQPPVVGPSVGPGKFQPQYINNTPLDPTAPFVGMSAPVSPGFGGQSMGGFGHSDRSYFGGGSTFSPSAPAPNMNPGNMFGRPEMKRQYFR